MLHWQNGNNQLAGGSFQVAVFEEIQILTQPEI